jgi:hypothetical protein
MNRKGNPGKRGLQELTRSKSKYFEEYRQLMFSEFTIRLVPSNVPRGTQGSFLRMLYDSSKDKKKGFK